MSKRKAAKAAQQEAGDVAAGGDGAVGAVPAGQGAVEAGAAAPGAADGAATAGEAAGQGDAAAAAGGVAGAPGEGLIRGGDMLAATGDGGAMLQGGGQAADAAQDGSDAAPTDSAAPAEGGIDLSPEHDAWVSEHMHDGWAWGAELDEANRRHPFLVAFDALPWDRHDCSGHLAMLQRRIEARQGSQAVG